MGGTVSHTREGRCQKTSQGGEGIFRTSTAIVGIGLKGGHSPGSPCTAKPHWAEQNKLPARGEPHLLARSVLELREEVRWYLSFTDEEVFWGVALPEEEEEESLQTPGPTNFPEAPCVPEPVPERRAGWEKLLHPSQPVVAARDIPQLTRTPRLKVGVKQIPQMISIKPLVSPPKTPTLPQPSPSMQALVLA